MSRESLKADVERLVAHLSLSLEAVPVFVEVQESRAKFRDALMAGFAGFGARGQWKEAVNLVLREARVTEAELAKELGVSRSTVNRWAAGETRPPSGSLPLIVAAIKAMIRRIL